MQEENPLASAVRAAVERFQLLPGGIMGSVSKTIELASRCVLVGKRIFSALMGLHGHVTTFKRTTGE